MKKETTKKELIRIKYLKPMLTKHKKLRDITALRSKGNPSLGCTKF